MLILQHLVTLLCLLFSLFLMNHPRYPHCFFLDVHLVDFFPLLTVCCATRECKEKVEGQSDPPPPASLDTLTRRQPTSGGGGGQIASRPTPPRRTNGVTLVFSFAGTGFFLNRYGLTFCLTAFPVLVAVVVLATGLRWMPGCAL